MQKLQSIKLFALCSVGVVGLALQGCSNSEEAPAQPPTQVVVETTELQAVPVTDTLPGRVVAYETAQVMPQVTGIIEKQLFIEGSFVKAGQPLYRIDTQTYSASVDAQKAAVQRARSNLQSLESTLSRYQELKNSNAISKQEFDDAQSAYDLAKADLLSAQAGLESASVSLNRTVVRAPISGKTGRSNVDQGALVTAGSGTALVTISQLDPAYVDLSQPVSRLLELKQFSSEATGSSSIQLNLPNSNYNAVGRLLLEEAQVDPDTGSAALRAVFPNEERVLLPGMYVTAKVSYGSKEAVLVPQSAMTRTAKGDAQVWVVQDNKAVLKPVETSGTYQGKWIVSSGLASGETLVIQGGMNLRQPGQPVSVKTPEAEQAQTQPAEAKEAQG